MVAHAGQELRDPEALERWICTGLCLTRAARPSERIIRRAIPWIEACVHQAPALPPVGFIADLGALLEADEAPRPDGVRTSEPALDRALRAYEDAVFGRLARDPRLDLASDALSRLPDSLRAEGVAALVEHLMARLRLGAGTAVVPAAARRVLRRPPAELLARGLRGLREDGELMRSVFTRAYRELVDRARHIDTLLSDADLFLLQNLSALRDLGQRVAVQQIMEAAQVLSRELPRRAFRSEGRPGATSTRVHAEGAFPAGGFASLSRHGALDSLLCSELAYMEQDGATGLDLFDVRFAEDDLLHYSRDEAVLRLDRRCIAFLLHPDLARARVKDPNLPWQRLVLVLGLILCAVRQLETWLGRDALRLRVVFVAPPAEQPDGLEAERQLCQVLLRESIQRGTVEVTRAPPGLALLGHEAAVVHFCTRTASPSAIDAPASASAFGAPASAAVVDAPASASAIDAPTASTAAPR